MKQSFILRPYVTARAIALELRRQERHSDFTGYTENYTFKELVEEVQLVGGPRWELSCVPLRRVRCWNTRTPVARLLVVIADDEYGRYHIRKVHRLAAEIRRGNDLPGIVVTNHPHRRGEHSILSGFRRLAAHRVAKAATILVYHPAGLFGQRGHRHHRDVGAPTRPMR